MRAPRSRTPAALSARALTGQGVILDRSVFSDWVFAEKNRLDGTIDAAGFAYYEALRAQLLRGLPLPSVTLYLDVAPQVCFDRVHKLRGRDCESGIPLDYLAGLGDVRSAARALSLCVFACAFWRAFV